MERTDSGFVWVGKLDGVVASQVTLAVSGSAATSNALSGSIVTPNGTYSIRFNGNNTHLVEQVDLNTLPPDESVPLPAPQRSDSARALADSLPLAQGDDGSLIDVLVVYTPGARLAAGGIAAINSLIDLGVSETNQAYANAGSIQRIRLRRKEEIDYTEFGDMGTDLSRLQENADGFMDSVHSLRNTYGADIVQLIEKSPDSCGLAYITDPIDPGWEAYAFGITHYSCISPNYSFAHEMGHNMGLRHDIYVDSATTPYTYAHGYVNQAAFVGGAPANKRWRTIMAYNDQCAASSFNCTRLLYFANPNNTNTGDPMGNENTAYDALVLDNSRVTTANFRTSILEPLDNFTNSRFIFTNNFTDLLATATFTSEGTDPTPTCGDGVKQKSAWYRFTPGANGVATFNTFGSSYDTVLSIYTGGTGSFVSVGCNDDANSTPQSQLTLNVTAGTTYSVMISAKVNEGGTLILNAEIPIERKRHSQLVSE